jgi:MFS family permease
VAVTEESTPRSRIVTLLMLTFAMNFVARGVPETFAVFLLPVQNGLGVSRSQITLTYSLYMLTYGLFGPIAGLIIDRLGARAAYAFGLSCLGSGYLLAGFSHELWHYLLAVGLLGGIGAAALGMIVASALPMVHSAHRRDHVAALCGDRRRHARAAAVYDWRIAHRLIGGGVLATLPLVMLLPLGRMTAGSNAWRLRHATAATAIFAAWSRSVALRTSAFWGPVYRLSLHRAGGLQHHSPLRCLPGRARL